MTDEAEKLRAKLLQFVADARELKQLRAENIELRARLAEIESTSRLGAVKLSDAQLLLRTIGSLAAGAK